MAANELCVVFDVDDTLFLERDYVASGFRAVGDWAVKWLSIPDFADRCLDRFDSGKRGDVFNHVLQACGREANTELISGLVAIYRGHWPRIKLAPDAANSLGEIRLKWPVAVVTDGPVISQSLKCEALELPGVADPIILTGVHGDAFHKPKTGAFELIARRIEAKRFVYIADNPAKDFTAPRQLGWRSVRIRRNGGLHCYKSSGPALPDYELPDCTALRAILEELASPAS